MKNIELWSKVTSRKILFTSSGLIVLIFLIGFMLRAASVSQELCETIGGDWTQPNKTWAGDTAGTYACGFWKTKDGEKSCAQSSDCSKACTTTIYIVGDVIVDGDKKVCQSHHWYPFSYVIRTD